MTGQTLVNLEKDVKDHEVRIRVLETDNTKNKAAIDTLTKTMDKIEGNTTWILRLIVGSIVTALIGLVLKGGF